MATAQALMLFALARDRLGLGPLVRLHSNSLLPRLGAGPYGPALCLLGRHTHHLLPGAVAPPLIGTGPKAKAMRCDDGCR